MISFRTHTTRPVLASLAALLLAACDPSAEHSSARLEQRLDETAHALEQSRAALTAAERRIGELQDELDRRVGRLARQLASARERMTRGDNLLRTVQRQRDASVGRARRLQRERAALRADLAGAGEEIRRLRARHGPDQRRLAELHERGAAAAREVDELRRYNAYLLRERGNLQAWLEEANGVRKEQQDARRRTEQELARVRSQKEVAEAAAESLRSRLGDARTRLASLERSRDALLEEVSALRVTASDTAKSGDGENAAPDAPVAGASNTTADGTVADVGSAVAASSGDTAALHAELDEAQRRIAGLRAARDYLVEKVEACAAEASSADAGAAIARARLAESMGRRGTTHAPRARAVSAPWGAPSADALGRAVVTIPVAEDEAPAPEGRRRAKELEAAREALAALEREHAALESRFTELEQECAAVREQVQTLTWANEVLVKELDTAYATGGAGKLPEGTRGIYLLREGESLSKVAQAFYGDAGRWQDIVEANKTKIPDPDKVKAGTVILIPE